MQKKIDFVELLSMIQEHISSRYAAALSDSSKLPQLRKYIETPDKIHDLGIEFLNRAFNGYEGVVATHLNTDCLHNHLVVNSVQAKSGLKFNDCLESYYNLRQISDELCREYDLSVIENPKKRSRKPYDLYMAEKNGEWTKDAIIKRDIDECILKTTSETGFYTEMRKLGSLSLNPVRNIREMTVKQ